MRVIIRTKKYKIKKRSTTVLKNVDLTFSQNGLVIILGSSGCGKTTLLNIIAGVDRDYDGEVIDQLECDYICQNFMLLESMTVLENLELVSKNKDLIQSYLLLFDLNELKSKKVKKLSNGQKRRVQVVRSLLLDNKLLLCDEPTAALDYEHAVLVMEELKKYAQNHLVIVVTHDIALADMYADRLIKMNHKHILEDKNISDVLVIKKENKDFLKKTWKDNLVFSLKSLFSRPFEFTFQCIFIFLILFSTYLSFSVFKNVSQENNEKISFPNHYNSIISEPFQRKEMSEYYDYSIYTNYDRYWTQEVINMVNEITDIKAVSMLDAGSNLAYLSMTSPLSNLSEEENNQRALKENEYIEEVFPFFTMPMYSLDDVYVRDDEVSNLMMSNIFYYSKNVDYYDSALPDDSLNRAISIYDLTNNYIPPLLAGHASNKNDEAIISQNFADLLLSEMHLHDYDELIGQSFRTGIFTSSNHADIQRQHREFRLQGLDESETRVRCYPQEINVKIAAVSSLNFEGNEFVVFFNSGLTNNLYFNALLSHKEKYRSNYVNVFIDPQSDTEKIADKMNQIMPPFFSRFIPYTQSMYQLDHYYRSSSSLLIYLVILNIIFLLGYLFVQLCNYRRSKKEANIFNHYHYDYLKITIFKNLLLMFIALCFFMVSVWLFFPLIDKVLNVFNFENIVSFSIIETCFILLLLFLIIEIIDLLIGGRHNDLLKKYR